MPERRLDDLVGPDGQPISVAHKAIYDYVGQCRDELMADHDHMATRALEQHLKEHHHRGISEIAEELDQTPEEIMKRFIGAVEISERVVDALDGRQVQQLDGSFVRQEEEGLIFQVGDIRAEMKNGIKHKAQLSKPQWTAVASVAASLATIAVALITSGGS